MALILALMAGNSWAANLSFLAGSAMSRFKGDDVALMNKTALDAIATSQVGETRAWSNTKTGNSGQITLLSNFTAADGVPCKRLRVASKSKQMHGAGTYSVCKRDSEWRLDAAKPMPPPVPAADPAPPQ